MANHTNKTPGVASPLRQKARENPKGTRELLRKLWAEHAHKTKIAKILEVSRPTLVDVAESLGLTEYSSPLSPRETPAILADL